MNQYKIEAPVKLVANTVLGLTEKQFAPRAHNLVREEVDGLPDNVIGCRAIRDVQFKAGEVLWAASLPKNLAALVTAPVAEESGAESKKPENPPVAKPAAKRSRKG